MAKKITVDFVETVRVERQEGREEGDQVSISFSDHAGKHVEVEMEFVDAMALVKFLTDIVRRLQEHGLVASQQMQSQYREKYKDGPLIDEYLFDS